MTPSNQAASERKGHTLLHDTVVLLLLGSSLQTLPRELTAEEVLFSSACMFRNGPPISLLGLLHIITHHQNVTQRLQIISPRLLHTQMSVDRRVSRRTRQVLVLPIRNVQVRLGITVFLGETEVNHVDLVAALADTHEEIVGLDVAVDKVARVNVFDTRDELVCEQEDGFE